jgi:hypothetical protein
MVSTVDATAVHRVRHLHPDVGVRRGVEPVVAREGSARGRSEDSRTPHHYPRRPTPRDLPAPRSNATRTAKPNLLQISAVALFVGCVGWCLLLRNDLQSSVLTAPASTSAYPQASAGDAGVGKSALFGASTDVHIDPLKAPDTTRTRIADAVEQTSSFGAVPRSSGATAADGESAASIVARDFSYFPPVRAASRDSVRDEIEKSARFVKDPNQELVRVADRAPERVADRAPVRVADQVPVKEAKREPAPAKAASIEPQVRVATLESAPLQIGASFPALENVSPHIPGDAMAKTSLVDFETAPFPYHGNMPDSDRPFLNAGEAGHRGHVNFRGRVLWEAETFNDDRVLLHIPPGFDARRPAVMVVFFHGHGANLARDVRDRQLVPAQITAAGVNAVVVAPQFAVDAADSSAGKFWEPNGFKRFLDEAAKKLAGLYGDPRSAATFANMPIVIVAYSGGFGPTLSVLDRGGVRPRVRGLVLLDALYAGIDRFADWIADNRSTFFVSSYTPHTAHHNADLEHALRERSVPYGSELRHNHLQGMVAFLPAGDVPHRNFVTHAWSDNPIEDVLLRMDDVIAKIETAGSPPSISAAAYAAPDRN